MKAKRMDDQRALLRSLISAPGLSGYETSIRELIEKAWRPMTDELFTSRLGSLHGLRRGVARQPRPSLLVAAHMDAIGLMVTGLVDGFLRVTEIGGLDGRVLPGQLVLVHGRQDFPGVIVQPPVHLLPPEIGSKPVPIEYLLVDTGLIAEEVERVIRVGDLISFAQDPIDMGEDLLAGHSLDNRASVVALTQCLLELKNRSISWDLWAVATVQEEETLGGAATSVYDIRPTLAVAVDVTIGKGPGSPDHNTFPLGKGPALGWGPNIHPKLHNIFSELAEQTEIPFALEAIPRHSGTDALAMQVTAHGIPTMVVSIPLRYMHTPVEVVSMKDISRCGRLLAEFVNQLDENFMEKLLWDD